jgi:3-hydroxyisobutyrate dehydrogenase-like beta-hydroxyacid dehydrogenase
MVERIVNVGFIGLGHMGAPMSANILAAGHYLLVHDVRTEAATGCSRPARRGRPRRARRRPAARW